MLALDNFVRDEKCSLHYAKSGEGSIKYLVFHGFGQDHSITHLFPQSNDRTYYVFDLFFHGRSEWKNGEQPLEKGHWIQLVTKFLEKEDINRFSLISFSIGSRFALTILESFPDRVESNVLIAPDGLKKSLWYWLATYPFITRKFFKSMITHHWFFRLFANSVRELKLLHKGLIRFAESQMNTKERRERAYMSWVVFRHLTVKTRRICELVNDHPINTTIIVGRNDKVITEKWTRKFTRNLAIKPKIVRLPCGHNRLLHEAAALFSDGNFGR